jgi:hypothetical protein
MPFGVGNYSLRTGAAAGARPFGSRLENAHALNNKVQAD